MKKILLAIVLAYCTLSAQESIRVNFKGASPTIKDFAWALLSSTDNEEECTDEVMNTLKQAWSLHSKGKALANGETLTIDTKSGFVLYEHTQDNYMLRIEMCYWNEADKKHKLFAYNVTSFINGRHEPGQFDGIDFYRYNNASKKMTLTHDVGFDRQYGTSGAWVSYTLPRSGKDITEITWSEKETKQKMLKWNGREFK